MAMCSHDDLFQHQAAFSPCRALVELLDLVGGLPPYIDTQGGWFNELQLTRSRGGMRGNFDV